MRDGGLELEYDLPRETTAEDRARDWQFPVRIFKPPSGPMQLFNPLELEARVEDWLKRAGWTRAVCGRWILTWTVYRIECEPQSVIKMVEAFDLRTADLRDGASYQEIEARGPGTSAKNAVGPKGATFAVVLEVDPDAICRARTEADLAAGEIMQKPVTLDSALRERAREGISGTISISFDADGAGSIWRRIKLTKLEIKTPDGRSESQTATETVERRLASGASAHR